MDTTHTTSWWSCPGCEVDVELVGADLTGFELPCPDCGAAMAQWRQWETAA